MSIEQKLFSRKVSVIIAAAGSAIRLNKGHSKQFLLLDGKPLLLYSLEKLIRIHEVIEIIVVSDDVDKTEQLIVDSGLDVGKKIFVIGGGDTRYTSVKNGVDSLDLKSEIVLIHDVARPLFDENLLTRAINLAYEKGACIYAMPVVDTMKKVNSSLPPEILETIDRTGLYQAQTPQIFKKDLLLKAYEFYETKYNESISITDESMLVELAGGDVCVVGSGRSNLKITYEEDIVIAEAILKSKEVSHIL